MYGMFVVTVLRKTMNLTILLLLLLLLLIIIIIK